MIVIIFLVRKSPTSKSAIALTPTNLAIASGRRSPNLHLQGKEGESPPS